MTYAMVRGKASIIAISGKYDQAGRLYSSLIATSMIEEGDHAGAAPTKRSSSRRRASRLGAVNRLPSERSGTHDEGDETDGAAEVALDAGQKLDRPASSVWRAHAR